MKNYFCCFKKEKPVISSYVEYYSNIDNISESCITNSLIDAIKEDDEKEHDTDIPIYHCNPLNNGCTTVVGGRNPQKKN
jgi:hypothetical protein